MALLLAVLLLAGCAAPAAESPAPTPALTPTTTAAPTPTPEPTPEPTEEPKELWGFPVDDTHDAFEVPTGGKLGTVLVTVEQEEDHCHLNFSVWKRDGLMAPIQTMRAESERHWAILEDVNFDGYMDFMYISSLGAANA